MLLKLAEELVKQSKKDSGQPIPVLFSLPNWKQNKQDIKDWLIEQLKEKYGVRKDISKQLIENEEIIPLLDGLDELAAERQELCVNKINEFLKPENWNNPLVICSRTQEYKNYGALLKLNSSIELCPYTKEQIIRFLQRTNNSKLWNSIINDNELSNLAKTPLFLNIIVLAAQDISIEKWQQLTFTNERLNYLLDAYINRMFKRPYRYKKPTEQQTKKWLAWLSQRLIEEQSTEFSIENIQPYWLKNKFKILVYHSITWGVIGGLIVWLIEGLIYWLNISYYSNFYRQYSSNLGLVSGIFFGLFFGLFSELIEKNLEKKIILVPLYLRGLIRLVMIGLIIGMIGGLIVGLIDNLINGMLAFSLISLLMNLLIFGLIGNKIKTVELLVINLKKSLSGLLPGLICLFIFLAIGQIWVIIGIYSGPIWGLMSGLILGSILCLSFGVDSIEIEKKNLPNQGIFQSIVNTIVIFLEISLFATPVIFIILAIGLDYKKALIISLVLGLHFGLLTGIIRSGTSAIRHFVLRLFLYLNGYIPWNYANFLEYGKNRLFLQRYGGSYRFMHELLRQHFANKSLAGTVKPDKIK